MTREEITNNAGYVQEKANLEYIRYRQDRGVNDQYMLTEIDEAFNAGFDKGLVFAYSHPNWISVEDELPKENEYIIAYNGVFNEVHLCSFHDGIFEDFYGQFNGTITHWMPIVPPRNINQERRSKI